MSSTLYKQSEDYSHAVVTQDSFNNVLSNEDFLCTYHKTRNDPNDLTSTQNTHAYATQMSQTKWKNIKVKKKKKEKVQNSSGEGVGWAQLSSGEPKYVTSSKGFFKQNSSNINFDERVESIMRVYPDQNVDKKGQKILNNEEQHLLGQQQWNLLNE